MDSRPAWAREFARKHVNGKNLGVVVCACHPRVGQEALNRTITVQASLDKKQYSISKITRAKRAGGMAQVVDYLPSKC
jgi:hypothetical protein